MLPSIYYLHAYLLNILYVSGYNNLKKKKKKKENKNENENKNKNKDNKKKKRRSRLVGMLTRNQTLLIHWGK